MFGNHGKVVSADPFEKTSDQGPHIDQEMFDKVMGMIEAVTKGGLTVAAGEKRTDNVGFFVEVKLFNFV